MVQVPEENPANDESAPRGAPWNRKTLLLFIDILALIWLSGYFIRSASPFEQFTTMPLGSKGAKLSLLIPRGWKQRYAANMSFMPVGANTTAVLTAPAPM